MRKLLRMGLIPARVWEGQAVGTAPTEKVEEADGGSSSRQERVCLVITFSRR